MPTHWRLDSNDDPTLGLWINVPRDPIQIDEPRDEQAVDTWGRDHPVVQRAARPWGRRWSITCRLWDGLNGNLTADEQLAVIQTAWIGDDGARMWLRSPDGRFCSPVTLLAVTHQKHDIPSDVTVTFTVVERAEAA